MRDFIYNSRDFYTYRDAPGVGDCALWRNRKSRSFPRTEKRTFGGISSARQPYLRSPRRRLFKLHAGGGISGVNKKGQQRTALNVALSCREKGADHERRTRTGNRSPRSADFVADTDLRQTGRKGYRRWTQKRSLHENTPSEVKLVH